MNEARWKKIERLVEQALDLPPDEKAAFIQKECGQDEELKNEINSLLQYEEQAFSFIREFSEGIVPPSFCEGVENYDAEDQRINTIIGHYQITDILGRGGMGVVYKARDTKLDRPVALKFLPSHLIRSKKDKQRFLREAKAAAALNHPNICTIHSVEEYKGQNYISMEYIDGQTLREKLDSGNISPEETLKYAIQITEALAEAHEKGVIHRDIKPGNIMVDSKGRIKITDFGLAKFQTGSKFTKDDSTMGTVIYMSPEQIKGVEVDHRTDIWSLGVVIYEILTGKCPFEGSNDQSVIYSILNEKPQSQTTFRTGLPMELAHIVKKALKKNPDDRYWQTNEMIFNLKAIQKRIKLGKRTHLLFKRKLHSKERIYFYSTVAIILILLIALLYNFPPQRVEVIDSVAVLPLTNLMNDAEQDYFVHGMHDALINELSKISALKVISRTSTMRYQQTTKPLPQIARELNVNGVIQGSVLREGDQVRITLQLIHGPSDEHLWTNTYQRELRNVLAMHSELARSVAEQIQVTLDPEENEQLARTKEVDPAAYEDYLRGLFHWNKLTSDGWKAAIDDFERSIKKNPSFAPAHAMISFTYSILGYYSFIISPSELHDRALTAAERAVSLDSTLAEAHASLSLVKLNFDWDWSTSDRASQKAMQLNPNSPIALLSRGLYLSWVGRHDESIAIYRRIIELDPVALWANNWLGSALFFARRYDEAIKQANNVLTLERDYQDAHRALCQSYSRKGVYEDLPVDCTAPFINNWRIVWFLASSGKTLEARKVLQRSLDEEIQSPTGAYFWAMALGELGEMDRAFTLLERAYNGRTAMMPVMKVDPRIDALRDDPRFQDLLDRMNFPE